MARMGLKEDDIIESALVTKQIANAQRKVEAHNFDARKNLLEYDDVANDQRKVVYQQRSELMAAEDVADAVTGIRREVIEAQIDRFVPPNSVEEMWDVEALTQALDRDFATRINLKEMLEREENLGEAEVRSRIHAAVDTAYAAKVEQYGAPVMRHLEKAIMLQQVDMHWREHLAAMDYLRQGIHLRSYAQKNPKQEYKREAFELFSSMLDRIKHDTISMLSRLQVRSEAEIQAEEAERQRRLERAMQLQHAAPESITALPAAQEQPSPAGEATSEPFVRDGKKVGRNEPCPCGSGKKYKHCHGALEK
jgi:preprotein translocase subunit SecA